MKKKKKGSRYTPPKPKPEWNKPWWMRRAYRGSGDKDTYFNRVVEFLEYGDVDDTLMLKVRNNRTRWHI